jgi:DNA protecting protein DprA
MPENESFDTCSALLACATLGLKKSRFALSAFEDPSAVLNLLPDEKVHRARAILDHCHRNQYRVLHPNHEFYPRDFLHLEDPPLFLSAVGNVSSLQCAQRLAIVGSRNLSARAEEWSAQHLKTFLKLCPQATVVSGGARGADQAAHMAAIREKRATICFLPSGLDTLYPPELSDWVSPILKSGGVFISQFHPGAGARREHFEKRNRLIVSLSDAVFVIEASRRSGSTMTARIASEMGKALAALPSFPGDAVGAGTLDLIYSGATLLRDGEDLAAFLNAATPSLSAHLVPSSLQAETGCDREQRVRKPHGDERWQLSFASGALGRNVQDVVDNNESDNHDHAAGFHVAAVCRRSQTHSDECE